MSASTQSSLLKRTSPGYRARRILCIARPCLSCSGQQLIYNVFTFTNSSTRRESARLIDFSKVPRPLHSEKEEHEQNRRDQRTQKTL
jgi:hypothetical protein